MSDFGPDAREFLQSYVDEHGFLSWLDVRVESVESGALTLRVPFHERLTNPRIQGGDDGRTVHGGVAATLIDTAGGLAVRTALEDPLAGGAATVDLDVSYLRPATDDLLATADVVRVGGTIGVSTVEVESGTDDGRESVAVGRGSYRVYRGSAD